MATFRILGSRAGADGEQRRGRDRVSGPRAALQGREIAAVARLQQAGNMSSSAAGKGGSPCSQVTMRLLVALLLDAKHRYGRASRLISGHPRDAVRKRAGGGGVGVPQRWRRPPSRLPRSPEHSHLRIPPASEAGCIRSGRLLAHQRHQQSIAALASDLLQLRLSTAPVMPCRPETCRRTSCCKCSNGGHTRTLNGIAASN